MKELIGKKILGMSVSDNQQYLKFTTDQGDVIYEAWADCCSESWFADIIFSVDSSKLFFGNEVVEVDEIQMPLWADKIANIDGRCRQDYDSIYGYKIVVKNGIRRYVCEVIYRNLSNGYYGGQCDYITTCDHDGEWVNITGDWSAS